MKKCSRRIWIFWIVILGVMFPLFFGCSKARVTPESGYDETQYAYQAQRKPALAAARADEDLVRKQSALQLAEKEKAVSANSQPARMIHHNGFLHLRTPKPRQLAEAATRIVEASGGYVERLDNVTAVFRVPVDAFQTVFARLRDLGDVLDHTITTEDITDDFHDVDLRLKIYQNTRQRLMDLLARTEDEDEKIRLLKEIQRLSVRIETLTARRAALLTKARFSTITLRIEKRRLEPTSTKQERIAAFAWIHDLTPFTDQVARSGKPLQLKVPEGLLKLSKKDQWVSESADGAVMRASRHERQPAGDTDFWMAAVTQRLRPHYAAARVLSVGRFKFLRLEDRSETPYIYLVGLHMTSKGVLEVVEIYFPTAAHEKRYTEIIFASLKGGAS